ALESHMGLDLDQLGVVDVLDEDTTLGEIELNTRPTARFHGSIPALTEQLRTPLAAGVNFLDSNLVLFGANDLSDDADVAARPEPKRSKTAAFVSDFRD